MSITIYIAIIILFTVLLFWTWNNSKDFEEITQRLSFIIIGMAMLSIITLILFNISKIGIQYQNNDIMQEVRKISLLVFIPLNGFITLPHIASIKTQISLGADDNKAKKKIIIMMAIWIVAIVIETIYLKNFQNGIIQILNSK